jgi:chorismate mutase
MDINELKSIQAAAFAAWKACPEKNLGEKARLAAELDAATKAVAAAKRAANPAPVVDPAAEMAAWKQKEAAKAADRDLRNRLWKAICAYNRAQEYPRCGQNWGDRPGEREAEALIRANADLSREIAEALY